MTRDDILRWAQEEGVELPVADLLVPYFERFAALVAAHEREECAQVCEQHIQRWVDDRARYAASECCFAIRARGTP